MKRVFIVSILLFIIIAPLCAAGSELLSTVPVRFSFGTETTTHIEFGFTRNSVTDMGVSITEISDVELAETSSGSLTYRIPYNFFVYWRILAATDYSLSLRHTGYLDDLNSSNSSNRILFNLKCGSDTIPANADVEIFSHTGSVTPTVQSKPIELTTTSKNINASYYMTTLTVTLTAIE